jgi:hypothetical protein
MYERIAKTYADNGDTTNQIKSLQKALDIYYNNQKNNYEDTTNPLSILTLINYMGTTYCQKLNDLQNCKKTFEDGARAMPEFSDILDTRLTQLTTKK